MRKLLVGRNVAYAAAKATPTTAMTATTPNLLADGALGVYFTNADGVTLIVAPATAGAGQITIANAVTQGGRSEISQAKFTIAVGTPTGCKITDSFSLANVANGYSKEYQATTLHKIVQAITPVAGGSATVRDAYVFRVMFHNEDQDFETYDVTGTFATATLFADAVVAKINANPSSRVTAVNTGGAVDITAKEVGLAFSTAWELPTGASQGAKTTTAMSLGNGVATELAKLEALYSTHDGFTAPFDGHLKKYPRVVSLTTNYDTYFLTLLRMSEISHEVNNTSYTKRQYVIAVPDVMDAVGADGFATIFAGLFDADVSESGDAVAAS